MNSRSKGSALVPACEKPRIDAGRPRTSPLPYFIAIGHVDLLRQLLGPLIVSGAVLSELTPIQSARACQNRPPGWPRNTFRSMRMESRGCVKRDPDSIESGSQARDVLFIDSGRGHSYAVDMSHNEGRLHAKANSPASFDFG